jgi:hypothetical protein
MRPLKIYEQDNFSSDAIASRFNCGSWNDRDVKYIVTKLRNLEYLSALNDELKRIDTLIYSLPSDNEKTSSRNRSAALGSRERLRREIEETVTAFFDFTYPGV